MIRGTMILMAGVLVWIKLGAMPAKGESLANLKLAPSAVVLLCGAKADPAVLQVNRSWRGAVCNATVVNTGKSSVRVARVDLLDCQHG